MASLLPQDRQGLVAALYGAIDKGNFDEGDRIAGTLCETHGDIEPLGFVYLAHRDIMKRAPEAAIARLNSIAPKFPKIPGIQLMLAVGHSGGDDARAETFFNRARELAPEEFSVNLAFGKFLFEKGRMEEAIPLLRQAVAAAPENGEVAQLLAQAQTAQQSPAGRKLPELLAQHAAALETGDLNTACAAAETIAADYPGMAEGPARLADALLRLRRHQDALDVVNAATAQFPDNALLIYIKGCVFMELGQLTQALPFFRRAVVLQPELPEANFRLGHCLYRAGQYAESSEVLKRAVAVEPANAEYRAIRANALIALERFEEARAELQSALRIQPSRDDLRRILEDIAEPTGKASARASKIKRSKWPAAVTAFSDLRTAISQYVVNDYDTRGFVLKPGMSVLTQGSCFARNLALGFKRYPLTAFIVPLGEEHNSPFANAVIMRWLIDGAVDDETRMAEANLGADMRAIYLEALREVDLYVFTMGVAPAFFDRKTGRFQMPHANATSAIHLARNCVFRTTTVAENVEQLNYIVNAVRKINPKTRTVITVSPVPLNTTLEMASPVIADCLSKSTLRIAAHEVSQASNGTVQYWPSFEIVRWLATHHGVVFGAEDGSSFHVNRQVVEAIVDSFVDTFGSPELRAGLGADSEPAQAS